MSDSVLTDVVDGVLVVTLNRPDARNAINTETAVAVGEAMDRLDSDPSLVSGIITGAGGTFCAGMDLKAFLAGEKPSIPGRGFAGIVEGPPAKPVIAAVEGYAIAGGFEIALACDMIVAADNAKFGLPEVKRGLVAAGGGLMRLPQRIPYHVAMEWALTGDLVTAQRAHEVNLVNRLAEPGMALDTALELARAIAVNGPLAVAATKRIIIEAPEWRAAEMFDKQREISVPVRESEDAREGATAFKEKRAPRWRGV
ncbi:crotonase/enoyl-CoA hydratase family protein [Planosporangium thailandense]|uniref:Crotonase/enoyl-CoA hydratase family protein n=1 Tax=Planosporangium thailandense TaxID=765197 RepID=A0ABX0Y355_9ACTN|nr:crotonase/enoyl-CoA hydratase family protein [Planosporangium thailandense]NJC71862.1 crotonase/enoyl-CoA hydratase family protein [Planosporangium thailandense]